MIHDGLRVRNPVCSRVIIKHSEMPLVRRHFVRNASLGTYQGRFRRWLPGPIGAAASPCRKVSIVISWSGTFSSPARPSYYPHRIPSSRTLYCFHQNSSLSSCHLACPFARSCSRLVCLPSFGHNPASRWLQRTCLRRIYHFFNTVCLRGAAVSFLSTASFILLNSRHGKSQVERFQTPGETGSEHKTAEQRSNSPSQAPRFSSLSTLG
jgi:hypothetical protein